jgi:hypothetical protein
MYPGKYDKKTVGSETLILHDKIGASLGVGTSIFMLAGFVAFVLVIVGIVKSQKIVKESIGDPSKVATMVIMGMVAALLVGFPGVNIVLASIFMHMVRTIDQ